MSSLAFVFLHEKGAATLFLVRQPLLSWSFIYFFYLPVLCESEASLYPTCKTALL